MSKRGAVALAVASALVVLCARARGEEASSTLSPPPLTLTLTPEAGGGQWKLRVENTGDVPVRIAADPRLLVLDLTPAAGKVARCALPDDTRPATDEGRELVIPSKRSWTTRIDPLFYCFGARERAMLVSGTTVKAQLGWPVATTKKPAAPKPPFIAEPVGAAIGRIGSAKALEGAPFTLTENATGAPGAVSASTSLSLKLPESQDAARGTEISSTVTLANDGDHPVTLLFRPEMLRLSVAGPAGSFACGATRAVAAPIRELYSTINVKTKASVSVLLDAVCPAGTFDSVGIYRITPILDTTGASARAIGLKTWDGTIEGREPMLLRVRSPRRTAPPPARPALD